MSAKFRASTVRHVKDRLRVWIDDHELKDKLESENDDDVSEEGRMSPAKKLEIRLRHANVSKGPTII